MKGVSAQTRRPALSRETIDRVIGGWPIWLNGARLGRLSGGHDAVICSVGRRTGRVLGAAVMVLREDPTTGEVLVVAGTRDAHRYRNACATPAIGVLLGAHARRPAPRLAAADRVGVGERPTLPTASPRHG
ncbi:MAG TPA: hypothetical protein VIV06_01645 [Candidatus Limnocylindrales bacterium]